MQIEITVGATKIKGTIDHSGPRGVIHMEDGTEIIANGADARTALRQAYPGVVEIKVMS
jgi:hypothetical protein